jgi:alkylation response protein AidB-like acyl-CoA dehydrogenase
VTPPLITVRRPAPETRREVRDFAASARTAARSWPGYGGWSPAEPCDDRDADLRAALGAIGWFDVADEPDALPFVAAAAVELGRVGAPLDVVDSVLGRPLVLGPELGRGVALGRYADGGDDVWACGAHGLTAARVATATPVAYVDSVGAALLDLETDLETDRETDLETDLETTVGEQPSENRVRAWTAATAGYAAGLAAELHDRAATYACERQAFGGVLADLDVVAAKLSDTAMASEGLLMALEDTTGPEAVRHAVRAAVLVSRTSQQLHGGIGFTLEFPLQRLTRRAWALESWTLAVLGPITRGLRWIP